MATDERRAARHAARGQRARLLDHPVYLSLLAGAGLALAMVSTIFFSWITAALGVAMFLWGAGRWTWAMRHDYASMITRADPPTDGDTRREH